MGRGSFLSATAVMVKIDRRQGRAQIMGRRQKSFVALAGLGSQPRNLVFLGVLDQKTPQLILRPEGA